MSRFPQLIGAALTLTLSNCAQRAPLRELPPAEQRVLGEAAIVEACGFGLDVESTITRHHRETWAIAHEYFEIASAELSPGELSQFFSTDTLAACGVRESTEAGGVSAAVGDLIRRYGTDAEVLIQVERVASPESYCAHIVAGERDPRYLRACAQLGLSVGGPITDPQPQR